MKNVCLLILMLVILASCGGSGTSNETSSHQESVEAKEERSTEYTSEEKKFAADLKFCNREWHGEEKNQGHKHILLGILLRECMQLEELNLNQAKEIFGFFENENAKSNSDYLVFTQKLLNKRK